MLAGQLSWNLARVMCTDAYLHMIICGHLCAFDLVPELSWQLYINYVPCEFILFLQKFD